MNIQFYVERDGEDSARETIRMHFRSYLEALTNVKSHASTREYRGTFVDSLQAMTEFLGDQESHALMHQVLYDLLERARRAAQLASAFVVELNNAVRCAYPSAKRALEDLRAYPLDSNKASEATGRSLSVKAEDYLRAEALLAEAGIDVL